MNILSKDEQMLAIAAVERDTGLSKDTLRVWERRYGFPRPVRDGNGDRLYPFDQVDKLRLIRRLLDQGNRPARVVGASIEELTSLIDVTDAASQATTRPVTSVDVASFLQFVRLHRAIELRHSLQQMLLKQGLQRFVADTLCVLNAEIGQAWMRGELDVPEEHLYTELVQNVLRTAIGSQSSASGRPRVMLTTFPDEQHSLGLLMVEAMLVPEGATCVSLGIQTPIADIASAAAAGEFDIVALSFSGAFPVRQAIDGLKDLRRLLPHRIELWAGGAAVQGRHKRLEDVRIIDSLDDALIALADWRDSHPGESA